MQLFREVKKALTCKAPARQAQRSRRKRSDETRSGFIMAARRFASNARYVVGQFRQANALIRPVAPSIFDASSFTWDTPPPGNASGSNPASSRTSNRRCSIPIFRRAEVFNAPRRTIFTRAPRIAKALPWPANLTRISYGSRNGSAEGLSNGSRSVRAASTSTPTALRSLSRPV